MNCKVYTTRTATPLGEGSKTECLPIKGLKNSVYLGANSIAGETLDLEVDKQYVVMLTQVPLGYRLVTDIEKRSFKKPDCAVYYCIEESYWITPASNDVWSASVHCIPEDFVFEDAEVVTIGDKKYPKALWKQAIEEYFENHEDVR